MIADREAPLRLYALGSLRLSGPAGELLPRRRKELALLVVLASRSPSGVRREEVQSLFWGDRGEDRARHSLRQALLHIRHACGNIVQATPDTLTIDETVLDFDVRHFADAVDASRYADAAMLWSGDFLPACEDVGAEGFREWLDVERERLRRLATFAFDRAVADAEDRQDWTAAAQRSAKWLACFGCDDNASLRHIVAHCRAGRLSEAEAARAAFLVRLRAELDEEPSAEWHDAVEAELRAARAAAPREAVTPRKQMAAAAPEPEVAGAIAPATSPPTDVARPRGWRVALRLAGIAAAMVAAVFLVRLATHDGPSSAAAGERPMTTARRLFDEGVRAFYDGDEAAAHRLLRAAVAEDSTFAMAAYYAARVSGPAERSELLDHAVRVAAASSDHDRLFVTASWLAANNDPAHLATAETLAVRYPSEPDAQYEYARALVFAGRFLEAIPHYRHVIDMDSLGVRRLVVRCAACEAYTSIIHAYTLADSAAAAERVARKWIERQPRAFSPWLVLSAALRAQSRFAEAKAAIDSAARFEGDDHAATRNQPDLWLRTGDFDAADAYWRGHLATNEPSTREDALDNAISSLRIQGRLAEALAAAESLRASRREASDPLRDAIPHAIALFDAGDLRHAARLFDSLALTPVARETGSAARNRAWMSAHAATAYAAMGDTARLRELEAFVREQGAKSSYRRDQLLHWYVRGLRLRLAGKPLNAVEAFRRSLYSPVDGNARASFELGRTLVEMGRPAEAIPWIRAALSGPIGASGQYVNRADLELVLARAYDGAGMRDSAAAHYAWVAHAWRNADARLEAQRNEIARRLRELTSVRSATTGTTR